MTSASLMYEAGHSRLVLLDNPKGWGGGGVGRGFQDGRTHVHLWLIHVNVWWKPPQYCKVISLPLKEPLDESERRVEKVGLKLNIQKTKNMATGPITSWQIDGETVETVADLIFGGSKITANGDCSHEIKRCLLLERKVMTNLDNILKSRDITLPTKVRLVEAMVFQWSCMDVRVGL